VPTAGFVIQKKAEELGASDPADSQSMIRQDFELGNHGWSHPDFNTLTVDQMEIEILRGEADRKHGFPLSVQL
jgi:peptidoglycan/xylan/chitin deacetylase (PgdA/CDA1 family)